MPLNFTNNTGSPLPFNQLAVPGRQVGPGATVDLLEHNTFSEVREDDELAAYIASGDGTLNDGDQDIDSVPVVEPGSTIGNNPQAVAVDQVDETSQSYVDMPGMSVTVSNEEDGVYEARWSGNVKANAARKSIWVRLVANGVEVPGSEREIDIVSGNSYQPAATEGRTQELSDGQVIKAQWKVENNGGRAYARARRLSAVGQA